MFQYSNILNDPAMTRVNIVGFSLNLGYLLCYYIYSENKVSTDLIFSYVSLSTIVFFEECCLLGCEAVLPDRCLSAFLRNVLSPSSWCKHKLSGRSGMVV
jgi:hypothetical protein